MSFGKFVSIYFGSFLAIAVFLPPQTVLEISIESVLIVGFVRYVGDAINCWNRPRRIVESYEVYEEETVIVQTRPIGRRH